MVYSRHSFNKITANIPVPATLPSAIAYISLIPAVKAMLEFDSLKYTQLQQMMEGTLR